MRTFQSTMEVLKIYVVLLSVFATALACDLTETAADIARKNAVEEYINTNRGIVIENSRYRLHYHVAPPVGWMNDPNGFSFFKGNYHLFYQFYPFDTSSGNIHWGHVVSEDLVEWTQQRIALVPESEQCFSGSAIEKEGTLVLIYTAHKRIENVDDESQYLAFSNDGVVFNKYNVRNPVISVPSDSSQNFRDPKVWKHDNYWYVIIGSQSADKMGRVLLYRSLDLGTWESFGVLDQSKGDLGYMWECPDFFELNGRYVLLMSPQGITNKTGDRYQNQHQTGYIIGSFDYQTGNFEEEVSFQEIDYGFDFYASQTMEKDGKRYLIAWMGSWDGSFPERADGWAGAMTIVRELTLEGDRILMKPIDAITKLREPAVYNGTLEQNQVISTLTQTGELIVSFDLSQDVSLSFKGTNDTELVTLAWDATTRKVVLTRNGNVRQGEWVPVSSESWRVFLDASSIEVFCGEGEVVFSSRVYPEGMWRVTNLGAQSLNVIAYPLARSVPE